MADNWITDALAALEAERLDQVKRAEHKRLRRAAIRREAQLRDIRALMARP